MSGLEHERRSCMAEMVKSKWIATHASRTEMTPGRTWRHGFGCRWKKIQAIRRTESRLDQNAAELLKAIKGGLPYLLRYQTAQQNSRGPHADYKDVTITVPQDDMSARDLIRTVAQALPGWQATAFPSHMTLYKEQRIYKHGQVI